jgi:CDP-diacylglycerol--serine O-phosphatidyltransferase
MKAIQSIIRQIPNFITSLNILSGSLAIVFAFENNLLVASILIFLAGLFDFFDGFAARLLKAYSEFGKSMDSLADVISFGIAPSVIMFQLLIMAVKKSDPGFQFNSGSFYENIQVCSAFIITVFSAIRLAKFNIDKRQVNLFIGVPTPANAFLIASLPLIIKTNNFIGIGILNVWVLIPLIIILSYLLVSELPMLSLKFKNLGFRSNISRYILIALSLLLIVVFHFLAIPAIFILYVVISLISFSK